MAEDEAAAVVGLLWDRSERVRRGPKPALTLARIGTAAIAIADAEGIHAVSMERVAARCNATKMALYRYVPGKTELVAVMADLAFGAAPVLDVRAGWRPHLAAWAIHLNGLFRRHPWIMVATTGQRPIGPNEMDWIECALAALQGCGLRGDEQMDAVLAVTGQVRNVAQQVIALPGGKAATNGAQFAAALRQVMAADAGRYPALGAALAMPGADRGLQFGLDLVLDGLTALIAKRSGGR